MLSGASLLQVTTLARAYAFLVECGQMTWQALEVAVLRPYSEPLKPCA